MPMWSLVSDGHETPSRHRVVLTPKTTLQTGRQTLVTRQIYSLLIVRQAIRTVVATISIRRLQCSLVGSSSHTSHQNAIPDDSSVTLSTRVYLEMDFARLMTRMVTKTVRTSRMGLRMLLWAPKLRKGSSSSRRLNLGRAISTKSLQSQDFDT